MSSTQVFLALVGLAVLGFLVWAVRVYRGTGEVKRLRAEYAALVGLPQARAYDSLERRLEELMKQHPGHPMAWYLRSIIDELKRDRR